MANDLTEELRVLVSAEVDKAIKGLKEVDKSTKKTETGFEILGKKIAKVFAAKAIINFAKESIEAYTVQNNAVNILNSTLEATGATAWTSSQQLQDMASALQSVTNYGDEAIIQMQSVLLGFKNIKGETFTNATNAILDMATVMQMDLSSAAQTVGKALDDPINGITSLQRQGFRFSEAQKDVIQSLIETGDTAAAQKIILDELETTYGGAAEAAASSSIQIKNAFGNLKEGIGEFIAELPFIESNTDEFIEKINFLADAFKNGRENWDKFIAETKYKTTGDNTAWNTWFNSLSLERQLKEAEKQLTAWKAKLDENLTDENIVNVDEWRKKVEILKESLTTEQEAAKIENDRLTELTNIENLMKSIADEYEKLGKNDPLKQLEEYEKQLIKIENDKNKLLNTSADIDTTEALQKLEYNKSVIQKKIKDLREEIQKNGKKSWQQYFEDVTGVSESSFKNGKQAAEKYIGELENTFSNSKAVQEALGKTFDVKDAIEDQMSEIEKTITELLNIPADKIDSVYSLADNNIKGLIDRYKELNKQKKEFEVTDMLNDLNQQVNHLGKSEKYLYLETMAAAGATQTQLEYAADLLDKLSQASNKIEDSTVSWENVLEDKLLSGIEKLDIFKETADETKESIAGLGASLTNLSLKGALTGIESLGKALGEGKSAGDSMKDALVAMSEEILNQLPTLFLQAGLQLIAQGQWPLGLGLMAAGLSTSFVSSFNQGKKGQFEANAFGGVYGSSEYKAFAKGGTFTNQIVSRPTLFRFASGSGFGTGLMGEAGPEAVMPLSRSADGRLGVDASGSGSYVQVLLEVNNYSAEKVQTRESTDDSGQKKIQIMIGSAINSHLSSGKADKALSARYGLKVQGV